MTPFQKGGASGERFLPFPLPLTFYLSPVLPFQTLLPAPLPWLLPRFPPHLHQLDRVSPASIGLTRETASARSALENRAAFPPPAEPVWFGGDSTLELVAPPQPQTMSSRIPAQGWERALHQVVSIPGEQSSPTPPTSSRTPVPWDTLPRFWGWGGCRTQPWGFSPFSPNLPGLGQ